MYFCPQGGGSVAIRKFKFLPLLDTVFSSWAPCLRCGVAGDEGEEFGDADIVEFGIGFLVQGGDDEARGGDGGNDLAEGPLTLVHYGSIFLFPCGEMLA